LVHDPDEETGNVGLFVVGPYDDRAADQRPRPILPSGGRVPRLQDSLTRCAPAGGQAGA
jgi:hypothetical protein